MIEVLLARPFALCFCAALALAIAALSLPASASRARPPLVALAALAAVAAFAMMFVAEPRLIVPNRPVPKWLAELAAVAAALAALAALFRRPRAVIACAGLAALSMGAAVAGQVVVIRGQHTCLAADLVWPYHSWSCNWQLEHALRSWSRVVSGYGLGVATVVALAGTTLAVRLPERRATGSRLVALALPPWTLALAELAFAATMTHRIDPPQVFRLTPVFLDGWGVVLVVMTALALVLAARGGCTPGSQRPHVRLALGALTFVLGLGAFAATRAEAHDARRLPGLDSGFRHLRRLEPTTLIARHAPCDSRGYEEGDVDIVVEPKAARVLVDGSPFDAPDAVARRLEDTRRLYRGRRGHTILIYVDGAERPAALAPWLAALSASPSVKSMTFLAVQLAPPVESATLGVLVRRRRCDVALHVDAGAPPLAGFTTAAQLLDTLAMGNAVSL